LFPVISLQARENLSSVALTKQEVNSKRKNSKQQTENTKQQVSLLHGK